MSKSQNTSERKKVAVVFGGRSPEHDVSVVSGLQALSALNNDIYEAFPLYIAPDGKWYIGEALRDRSNYLLCKAALKSVKEVMLDVSINHEAKHKGRLWPKNNRIFKTAKPIEFDIALLSFHGLYGEDGNIQGLMETANIPYTGMRTMATSLLMDKIATKYVLKSNDIPCLPYATLKRPHNGYKIPPKDLKEATKHLSFPACLKPAHLGSSIGVAKVESVEEIQQCLPAIFEFDDTAILEPFVENLVEYNVAIAKISGDIKLSAIERPKGTDELLDFKQKYLSDAGQADGLKISGTKENGAAISEGMLSLTRELNPKLTEKMQNDIKRWSEKIFTAISATGAPRIDFIGNAKTGELWMNEINPIPGSFGYFLWEAAQEPVLFTDLLTGLIQEALHENKARSLPRDPVPKEARLLKRAK